PKRTTQLRRLANVAHDDRAAVLVDEYDERWDRLWWVRLDTSARVLPEGAEAERARSLLAAKYQQYRERPPTGPVLRLTIRRWSSWEAAPSPT
ncbi:MAG: TIGR03668 family PPOX class F420-dependent oxidoreductase, partial [Candidatus Dormibacteraeota bacterium]|nr:TIGR03668 family PPOX class F420-dependent oxidoreductase [Candidatus Dormibacteraeota bacterium]